ncbi:MAG: hypothetical protein KKG14_03700 [Alphaproteobacteria bacterium]|nr:hypothetical protein [Alphaproteobacteria bacterium]MBU2270195.1 hypothetical protein [Alphaproteobacteria bacterium]MBU2417786.1 hypothetical protein [Alphaproteobacteria bacterium]
MNRTVAAWFALAGLTGCWSLMALGAGEGAVLPGLLALVALGCAVDAGVRERVMTGTLWAFSGSGLRVLAILIGTAFLWQLVGVELALLMAGDVLVYVEVLAAVSLMAARTRFGPVRAALAARVRLIVDRLQTWPAVAARSARAARPVRRRPPPTDDADGGMASWALA